MTGERGQALVEATVAIPVCLAVAVTIVDCGLLVRDRIAVTHAATRAAEAHLAHADVEDAARGALPVAMRRSMQVSIDGEQVEVHASSTSAIASLAGRTATHSSRVELTEGAR